MLDLEQICKFELKSEKNIDTFINFIKYNFNHISFFVAGNLYANVINSLINNKKLILPFFKKLTEYLEKPSNEIKITSSFICLLSLYYLHKNNILNTNFCLNIFEKIVKNNSFREEFFYIRRRFKYSFAAFIDTLHFYISYFMYLYYLHKKIDDNFYKMLFTRINYKPDMCQKLIDNYSSLKGNLKPKLRKILAQQNSISSFYNQPSFLHLALDVLIDKNLYPSTEKLILENVIRYKYHEFISLIKSKVKKSKKIKQALIKSYGGIGFLFLILSKEIDNLSEYHYIYFDETARYIITILPKEGFETLYEYLINTDKEILLINHPNIIYKDSFLKILRKETICDRINNNKTDFPLILIKKNIIENLDEQEILQLMTISYKTTYIIDYTEHERKIEEYVFPVKFCFTKESLTIIKQKILPQIINNSDNSISEIIKNFFIAHTNYEIIKNIE